MTILEAAALSFGKYRTATTLTDIHGFSPKRYRENCRSTERLFYPRLVEALSFVLCLSDDVNNRRKYWRMTKVLTDVTTSWRRRDIVNNRLEFCCLYGLFEFEPRIHFTALNMSYLFILLLVIPFWWRRWWRWRRRRRPHRDDVVTTTSWRRRDDIVTTTSWWRRIYVDYSPFQPKTLRL